MNVPLQYFPFLDGSAISNDGKMFLFLVRSAEGQEMQLGFPRTVISHLLEYAAAQVDKENDDDELISAFSAGGFKLGVGPNQETILVVCFGGVGKISFLLSPGMAMGLGAALAKATTPLARRC